MYRGGRGPDALEAGNLDEGASSIVVEDELVDLAKFHAIWAGSGFEVGDDGSVANVCFSTPAKLAQRCMLMRRAMLWSYSSF